MLFIIQDTETIYSQIYHHQHEGGHGHPHIQEPALEKTSYSPITQTIIAINIKSLTAKKWT